MDADEQVMPAADISPSAQIAPIPGMSAADDTASKGPNREFPKSGHYKCKTCGAEFDNVSKYGSHRATHARQKKAKKNLAAKQNSISQPPDTQAIVTATPPPLPAPPEVLNIGAFASPPAPQQPMPQEAPPVPRQPGQYPAQQPQPQNTEWEATTRSVLNLIVGMLEKKNAPKAASPFEMLGQAAFSQYLDTFSKARGKAMGVKFDKDGNAVQDDGDALGNAVSNTFIEMMKQQAGSNAELHAKIDELSHNITAAATKPRAPPTDDQIASDIATPSPIEPVQHEVAT